MKLPLTWRNLSPCRFALATLATLGAFAALLAPSCLLAQTSVDNAVTPTVGTVNTTGNNLTLTGTATGTVGTVSGSGTLTKTGSGTWTFSNFNTYTGATTINAGVLEFGDGTFLFLSGVPTGAIIVNNGGTLRFARNNTFGDFSATATAPITINAGGLVTNTDKFNVLNNLTLAGGTLEARGGASPGFHAYHLKGTVTATGTTTSQITAPGGINSLNQVQLGNNVAGGTTTFHVSDAAGNLAISAALIDGLNTAATDYTASGLVKSGAGTLTLSGANTYSGGTTVNAGTLALGHAGALGSSGQIAFGGGSLQFSADNSTDYSGRFSTAANQLYRFDTNGQSVTLASALTSSGGSLTKLGTGTLTLTGANTYSGGTGVIGGLLQIDANSRLGAGALVLDGGGIQYGAAFNDLRPFEMGSNGATLDTNGFNVVYTGGIAGSGSFTKSGTGMLTLTSSTVYTGGTTVSGGTLVSHATGLQGAIVNNAAVTFDQATTGTYASVMSGSGSLRKTGAGTLTLTGANTYDGTTTIDAGTLRLIGSGSLYNHGAYAGSVVVNSGATLSLEGSWLFGSQSTTPALAITINSGGLVTNGGNSFNLLGSVLLNGGELRATSGADATFTAYQLKGTVTVGGSTPSQITTNGAANSTIQLQNYGAPATRTTFNVGDVTGNSAADLTISAVLADGRTGLFGVLPSGLIKTGAGTLLLSNANTFSGDTTISAGTLTLGHASALQASTVVLSGGVLNFGGYAAVTLGGLGGSGNLALSNASSSPVALTIGGGGSYSGALTGAGSLIKTDSDLAVLGGTNTYTGTTTIAAGTLQFSGPNALYGNTGANWTAANLVVNSGATAMFSVGGDGAFTAANIDTLKSLGTATGGFMNGSSLGLSAANAPGNLFVYSSVIADPNGGANALGLVVAGGQITLSSANTYTGGTIINGGTLALGGNERLADTGALTINGGHFNLGAFSETVGTVNMTTGLIIGSGTLTATSYNIQFGAIAASLAGSGPFVKTGGGYVELTAANTFSGPTTIREGQLVLSHSLALQGSTLTILPGASIYSPSLSALTLGGLAGDSFPAFGLALTIGANGGNASFTGDLSGSGSLSKTGVGIAEIAGVNTYSGVTTVLAGTLLFGQAASLYNGTTANWTPTNLVVNSGATAAFGVGGTGGFTSANIDTLKALGTSTGGFKNGSFLGLDTTDGGDFTYGSVIANINSGSNVIGLVKLGLNTLTLTAAHTYSGGTHVNGGILALGSSERLLNAGAVTVNGGTFALGAFSETVGAVTLQSGSITSTTGVLTGSSYAVQSGTVSAVLAGAGALTKSTAGTVTLSGANTYTGGTLVNAGTLALGASERLANTRALTVSGGTFDLGGFSETVGIVTLESGAITSTTGVLTGSLYDIRSGTISAVFGGSAGLTKTTTATVTLSGANSNTNTGVTQVNGGTLALGASERLLNTGAVTVNGGIFDLGAFSETVGAVTLQSGAITSTTGALTGSAYDVRSGTVSAVLAGAGALTKSTTSTVTLSGANTFTGGTTVTGGILALGASERLANAGAVTVTAGTFDLGAFSETIGPVTLQSGSITSTTGALTGSSFAVQSGTISAILAGAGALTKSTAGTVTLSGASTFTGGATVGAGTIIMGHASALGTGAVSLSTGTTLNASSYGFNLARLSGPGTLTGSGLLIFDSSANSTLVTNLVGSAAFTKSGSGTLTLSGANTFTGGTTISAGELATDSNTALGTGSVTLDGGTLQASSAARTLANAVTLNGDSSIGGSVPLTLSGAFTLARNRDLTISNSALTTFSGTVSESGGGRGLAKYGSGTLQLTGANTYTGGTFIGQGTVQINNLTGSAFGTGAVTVAAGATLTGAGSFTGALQLNGTFAPGNSPGTTGTGSQTWAGGANLIWEINNVTGTQGTNWDLLSISGGLTINATSGSKFTINLTSLVDATNPGLAANFNATSNYSFTFVTLTSGSIGGFSADKFTLNTSGFTNPFTPGGWSIAQSGNNLVLNYTGASAIPEPGTYAALAGSALFVFAIWRRRLRHSVARS